MKASTLKKLRDYFEGRVCSILVTPVPRSFDERQFADYFVGQINSIDEDGIWTTHAITSCKNFYSLEKVVAIVEEQVLYPDANPEHAKMVEEMKKAASAKQQQAQYPVANDNGLIDIASMERLVEQAKAIEAVDRQFDEKEKKETGGNDG
jgi:hypothetical protein